MKVINSYTLREWFDFDKRLYFVLICLLYGVIIFLNQEFIIHEQLYFEAYGEQLSYERITQMIELNRDWAWLNYVLLPIFVLIKVFLVSVCLLIGVLLSDIKLSFRKVFQIVLIAEMIYLIPAFIRTFYFIFWLRDFGLEDLTSFDPFSLLGWLGRDSLDIWWHYLLYSLNIFELLYWLTLALGFKMVIRQLSYLSALELVASSYGLGLLLWIAGVTFLIVSINP